jgi:hypothetical protein
MTEQLILHDFKDSDKAMILQALQDTRIEVLPLEDLADAISSVLERGIFYHGLNKSGPDRNMLKVMVLEDCQKTFRRMTRSEVVAAIENGYRGVYGEVRGIAPKDVYNWLNAYRNNELRKEVKRELEAVDDFKTPPTEEEERAMAMFNLQNAWETFKRTGKYADYGNVIYNILSVNKKISFDEEERNRFKALAKKQLLKYHAPERHLGNDIKMKEAIHLYNSIKTDNEPARIVAEAKTIALNEFFGKLLDEGKDIWDLFKL